MADRWRDGLLLLDVKSTDHRDRLIINFIRSKEIDDTAHPFFDLCTSSEIVWNEFNPFNQFIQILYLIPNTKKN